MKITWFAAIDRIWKFSMQTCLPGQIDSTQGVKSEHEPSKAFTCDVIITCKHLRQLLAIEFLHSAPSKLALHTYAMILCSDQHCRCALGHWAPANPAHSLVRRRSRLCRWIIYQNQPRFVISVPPIITRIQNLIIQADLWSRLIAPDAHRHASEHNYSEHKGSE